jgi:hypothetical protein
LVPDVPLGGDDEQLAGGHRPNRSGNANVSSYAFRS